MQTVHISLIPTADIDFRGKCAVILDILRASTTIVTALSNGCGCIHLAGEVDNARELARERPGALLGGERGGVKPDGFTFGNSPLEYKPDLVSGREIIFTTTNGARAALAAGQAETTLIGCFLNRAAAAEQILKSGLDAMLLCAGSDGAYSLEDALCAGFIADYLTTHRPDFIIDDSARLLQFAVSKIKAETGRPLADILLQGDHARRLVQLGFEEDIRFAADLDTRCIVPVCRNGIITRL
jgi:2-phosphosulfolactate phosphatase